MFTPNQVPLLKVPQYSQNSKSQVQSHTTLATGILLEKKGNLKLQVASGFSWFKIRVYPKKELIMLIIFDVRWFLLAKLVLYL